MFAVEIKAEFKGQNAQHPDKFFNWNAVQHAEKLALEEASARAIEMADATTNTWDNRPLFFARKSYGTDGGKVEILVTDRRWLWLNAGTSVRYATMTKGYVPKTRVGILYSYMGAGRVAYVNRNKPKPGIAARGWSDMIITRIEPIIHRVYRDELHTNWINT